MRKGDILTAKFRDKREVFVLSTVDAAEEILKERILPGNVQINVSKPLAIEKYNQAMGGVDAADQYISHYDVTRKTHAWYKKVGLNGLQRLLLNAFICFRCEKNQGATFLFAMKTAVAELTGIPAEPGARARSKPSLAVQPVHSLKKSQKISSVSAKCAADEKSGAKIPDSSAVTVLESRPSV